MMKIKPWGAGVSTLEAFATAEECSAFIAHCEGLGYETAAVQTQDGPRIQQDVRNNDRVILDDRALAEQLYE